MLASRTEYPDLYTRMKDIPLPDQDRSVDRADR